MATQRTKTKSPYTKPDGTWVRGRAAANLKAEIQKQADTDAMLAKLRDGIDPDMAEDELEGVYDQIMLEYSAIDLKVAANLKKVQNRLRHYIELCSQTHRVPTVSHIALALGTTRQKLRRIVDGSDPSYPAEICDAVRKVYTFLEGSMEQKALQNEISTVGWIFGAKNHFGYRDQMDIYANNSPQRLENPETLIAEAQLLGNDGEIDGDIDGEGTVE